MATRYQMTSGALASTALCADTQRNLARWNHERLCPGLPHADWIDTLTADLDMRRVEGHFLEELRCEILVRAAEAPTDPDGFIAWFEQLQQDGPGQGDPLFPWIAESATREQLVWFFEQEAAGEAGFDDLVAMTQVKLPVGPKLELARNYWDEMGRGNARGMHGPMLDALADALGVAPSIDDTVWESLALANAMTAMATSRRFAWHSVGALGVIELTAPDRSRATAAGLRRIGLSERERRYFDLHAVLDIKHSADWNANAIRPAVEEDPRRARAMAEGALIRLRCGERCFARYRQALWAPRGFGRANIKVTSR